MKTPKPAPVPPAETEDSAPFRFADLPIVSTLPSKLMKETVKLLGELAEVKAAIKEAEAREAAIAARLEKIQLDVEMPGLRWGSFAFASREFPGRETLDKTLLIEHGVSVAVLKACTKTGKSYRKKEFKLLKEDA